MLCRLCLNTLDEKNAVLLFGAVDHDKPMPENYLVHLISTHLYLCLSRDDAISTCICTECCVQLESFHNYWKMVELKQTTLCSEFLDIDCDVNWSEEGDAEQPIKEEEPELEELPSTAYDESEVSEAFGKADIKVAAHKFPCTFCEKSFKMRRYLEEHIATHTGDRPIACSYCEMAFRCRSNMYTHVKSKHTAQWLKARADRDAAKINSNNNIQSTENGDKPCVYMDVDVEAATQPNIAATTTAVTGAIPKLPPQFEEWRHALPSTLETLHELPLCMPAPTPASTPLPAAQLLSSIKSEPMEAINLSMAKPPAGDTINMKRATRSSRRKTHSPKKVQHTECSDSDDSSVDATAFACQVKSELTTSCQLDNSTDSLEQRLGASSMVQPSASSTATESEEPAPDDDCSSPSSDGKQLNVMYKCNFCGHQLRSQRAFHNHLYNKHNAAIMQATNSCLNCGEMPGPKHRCLNKPKYVCIVCGKSFKMKRYLEEHFATHTGVKLHTCTFCPTEFRSKSNMYHHTKRKHKLEWERSRASRSAGKTLTFGAQEPQQEELPSPAAAGAAAATTTTAAAADNDSVAA